MGKYYGGRLLVRRPKISCRTVRSMALVGVAEGSPTPKPGRIGDKSNTVNKQLVNSPCKIALDDNSPANELQKACKAFKT